MRVDIAIIGGGASGMTAAISAKKAAPKARVAVLEKLPRVGKKIIASGNGKCNLSNSKISAYNYHGSVDAVSIIEKMPNYRQFFTDELGILCMSGSEGREGGIYPRSNSSNTVVNGLRMRMSELGIEEICDTEITAIVPKNGGFTLITKDSAIEARRVIIAAGGYAGPSFGTDGSVMRMLRETGYKTAPVCPAVAPLRADVNELKGLKGVRIKGEIAAYCGNKLLRKEKGELQFNENNISGICVFNLAYLFGEYEGRLTLRADLMPELSDDELFGYINSMRKKHGGQPAEELLTGAFVKNLASYIVKRSVKNSSQMKVSELTNGDIRSICTNIKQLDFKVTGCSSWQNAQSTMGGIHASCVDHELQSKLHKGLYLCGEILDTAGDCGGYNLQWAWSSGMLAGRSCGKGLANDKGK